MTNNSVSPQDAVNFLNELLKMDHKCIETLIEQRIPCNEKIANHPTVQVLCNNNDDHEDDPMLVGLLGILNGLFGTIDNDGPLSGHGPISAVYSDYGTKLIEFRLTENNIDVVF